MRLSYDLARNVAYIRFRESVAEVETLRISDEVNIDLAPDGTVAGIELLNASELLCGADDGEVGCCGCSGGAGGQGGAGGDATRDP